MLDVLQSVGSDWAVQVEQASVQITKKDDVSGTRAVNETLLSRLRPFRSSSSAAAAASLVAMTASDPVITTRRDDSELTLTDDVLLDRSLTIGGCSILCTCM